MKSKEYIEGYEQARKQAVNIVKPIHTTGGNDENGCPHLCEGCRISRRYRDAILVMNPPEEDL